MEILCQAASQAMPCSSLPNGHTLVSEQPGTSTSGSRSILGKGSLLYWASGHILQASWRDSEDLLCLKTWHIGCAQRDHCLNRWSIFKSVTHSHAIDQNSYIAFPVHALCPRTWLGRYSMRWLTTFLPSGKAQCVLTPPQLSSL